jgi:antitoxin YefM
MKIYTASSARQNLFQLISHVWDSHEPANITSKEKNVVMINKDDYDDIQETLYLLSIPKMRESIQEAAKTPIEECVDKLDW